MAAVGPVHHCDAALRIARVRWRLAVNIEDRGAESVAMTRLDQLLEARLNSMAHARSRLGCCG